MRNSIFIIVILFAFLFCLGTKAKDWTEITKGQNGHIFFVDMENLNESRGYIYFWQLINYNEQDEYGDMAAKIYDEFNIYNCHIICLFILFRH